MDLKQQILQVLKRQQRQVGFKELQKHLQLSKAHQSGLRQALKEMVSAGQVFAAKGRKYSLREESPFVCGRVDLTRQGHAYIVPDEEFAARTDGDVFVRRDNLGGAMHGDRVEVRLLSRRAGRLEGCVERVLERKHARLVGRFVHQRKGAIVVARDPRFDRLIQIGRQYTREEIRDDDWVRVEITDWPPAPQVLRGRIVEILGRDGDPGLDVLLIVKDHGVETEFPPAALAAAEKIPELHAEKELAGRRDFRKLLSFTIDGETAKDFDDALSLEPLPEGGWRLGVHIADVAHYVRPGGALDADARDRATSIYPVDRVVPMLPERLSNELCSLKPDCDRLTMSALIELDANAGVRRTEFCNSIIHSRHRLTYEKVQRFFDGARDPEVAAFADAHQTLLNLKQLTDELSARRFQRGAIELDLPETEIIFDKAGRVSDVRRSERLDSHRLIEECMLLANEAVAEQLTRRKIPLLYRIHEPPDPDKVAAVSEQLLLHGVAFPAIGDSVSQKVVQAAVNKAAGRPNGRVLQYLILRAMMQARYAPENLGHFGLASKCYCHFTSPIRRYPDLQVHRALKAQLAGAAPDAEQRAELEAELQELGDHASERERRADTIERDCEKVKGLEFMRGKLGECFDGWITGLMPRGFFVELDPHPVEGMVLLKNLEGDYFEYDEEQQCIIGRRTRRRFRVGDGARVCVKRVDLLSLQMDLELDETRD